MKDILTEDNHCFAFSRTHATEWLILIFFEHDTELQIQTLRQQTH